ncbi:hypothetical protein OU995_17685 [Roseateles sp. SL47]|jgi:hypothetical protein|uniref:hypothetical protein n=1 Tax=Roseateles sp. SL47 TaxID=2995138 RepID=UPI00226EF0FD|nr:hypothetical protein [Roseateles sp. SL47]WAC71407.1 hypothetical protein OU995_17685 [Roseateles sp. SL47]
MSAVLTPFSPASAASGAQTGAISADELARVAQEAYDQYPASCSHSVWHVIKRYVPDQQYRTANVLIAFLEADRRWKEVPVSELADRASRGELIVGGLKETPNGHVVVVYPGAAKPAGGYAYTSGGRSVTMRARGQYPRVMSTSLSGWAGAKSRGDKTIWDPWANDAKFGQVRFWRLDLSAGQ